MSNNLDPVRSSDTTHPLVGDVVRTIDSPPVPPAVANSNEEGPPDDVELDDVTPGGLRAFMNEIRTEMRNLREDYEKDKDALNRKANQGNLILLITSCVTTVAVRIINLFFPGLGFGGDHH